MNSFLCPFTKLIKIKQRFKYKSNQFKLRAFKRTKIAELFNPSSKRTTSEFTDLGNIMPGKIIRTLRKRTSKDNREN